MTPVEPQIENHLRIMLHRWWLIVVAGVLTFAVVLVWQLSADDVYLAEGIAQIRVSAELADDGDVTEFQARSYAEMAATQVQLQAALESADLSIDVDEAASRLDISVLSTPGFIQVAAEGPSPADAEQLASGVLASIISQVDSDRAALPAEGPEASPVGTTASLVAPADAGSSPIGARPLSIAVLAAMVASIVVAEAAVLVWYLQGRLSLADPAGHVRALIGVRTLDLTGSDPEPILPFVAGQLARSPVVTVLQSGRVASAEVAVQVDRALSRIDPRVLTFDSTSALPEMRVSVDGDRMVARLDRASGHGSYEPKALHELIGKVGAGATVISATTASRPEYAFDVVREFPDAVLLVVDPRRTTKKILLRQATALKDVGATLTGVVLYREPRKAVPLHVADRL